MQISYTVHLHRLHQVPHQQPPPTPAASTNFQYDLLQTKPPRQVQEARALLHHHHVNSPCSQSASRTAGSLSRCCLTNTAPRRKPPPPVAHLASTASSRAPSRLHYTRSPVTAVAGSHHTAIVPQLSSPAVPRAKLCQSAALLTAPCLSLPANSVAAAWPPSQGTRDAGAAVRPNRRSSPPSRPTANRRPQQPRPQEQSAPSPRRAHKAPERRTTHVATPTSRPRGAQAPRMRWQPQAQRGKNRRGTAVRTDRRTGAPRLLPRQNGGAAATPHLPRSGASQRLFSPPRHEAGRLRRLCPQRCRQYPATSATVGAAPTQGAPPVHYHPDSSVLTGEISEKGPQPEQSLTECRPSCWLVSSAHLF
ncbi:hypothetical protein NDU88_001093 [Pleurodeles waltl]|uniref:Uncharacterized protein n=1 Tax=Pleurodeles waltl TaxID=8319 RepID=A0AAV7Q618_PLEWA|nr:hypothetical protein NDU88_001093 [Pleurodeles waltl]